MFIKKSKKRVVDVAAIKQADAARRDNKALGYFSTTSSEIARPKMLTALEVIEERLEREDSLERAEAMAEQSGIDTLGFNRASPRKLTQLRIGWNTRRESKWARKMTHADWMLRHDRTARTIKRNQALSDWSPAFVEDFHDVLDRECYLSEWVNLCHEGIPYDWVHY